MNKREMIHALIDRLLDIEESGTKKELHFSYMAEIGLFDFHLYEGNGSKEYVRDRFCLRFRHGWDAMEQFKAALIEIELIKNTPDIEPKVNLSLTVEKARELGLIA